MYGIHSVAVSSAVSARYFRSVVMTHSLRGVKEVILWRFYRAPSSYNRAGAALKVKPAGPAIGKIERQLVTLTRKSLAFLAGALLSGCAATTDLGPSRPQQAVVLKSPACLGAEHWAAILVWAQWWTLHTRGDGLATRVPDL